MPQFSNYNSDYQGKDRTEEFDPQDINDNKIIASLSYLGFLFFLPLVCCPNSRFGKFHANQGLILFLAELLVTGVSNFFHIIPVIGWLFSLVTGLINLFLFIVCIVWIVYTLSGTAREIPVIGKIKLIS